MEQLKALNDTYNMHKKIKQFTGMQNSGLDILKSEVKFAIKNIKGGKAVGPDELPGEHLKLIDEERLQYGCNQSVVRSWKSGEGFVRCVLSPLLFNIYSEKIISKALEEETGGIKINGIPINNLRYADDTVLLAENIEDLQRMLNNVIIASEEGGLSLNAKKTKYMVFTKDAPPLDALFAGDERLERVDAYTYLGARVTSNADHYTEIKIRIEKARAAFIKLKSLLASRDIKLDLRIRLLKCFVFPVLLYGGSMTLNKFVKREYKPLSFGPTAECLESHIQTI
ncbi:hypothetical protein LSTR_LSTR002300 [Laodelphax striatellus]|uniref:Reverse transcriptase domain-containing protein n=1 Tax=Laodelphax striatellus TaxID=195883 RepID=A0A482XFL8_LAOST|nr:hypothetical protein LSTR_LSTR002300 [Laodelphax striatellus]